MPMLSFRSPSLAALFCLGLAACSGAQTPPAGADTFYFTTKIGSFKILGAGVHNPHGHFEISFTGSVLFSDLDAKIQVSGHVEKEYENEKPKKVVYFGTGKIVVDGSFSDCQWFGRDMSAMFKGYGVVRMFGEFDKSLNTGQYWYGFDPDKKLSWGTSAKEALVPLPLADLPVVPKVRGNG